MSVIVRRGDQNIEMRDLEHVRQALSLGQLRPDDLVWDAVVGSWAPCGSCLAAAGQQDGPRAQPLFTGTYPPMAAPPKSSPRTHPAIWVAVILGVAIVIATVIVVVAMRSGGTGGAERPDVGPPGSAVAPIVDAEAPASGMLAQPGDLCQQGVRTFRRCAADVAVAVMGTRDPAAQQFVEGVLSAVEPALIEDCRTNVGQNAGFRGCATLSDCGEFAACVGVLAFLSQPRPAVQPVVQAGQRCCDATGVPWCVLPQVDAVGRPCYCYDLYGNVGNGVVCP
jgi:hypothetical protein